MIIYIINNINYIIFSPSNYSVKNNIHRNNSLEIPCTPRDNLKTILTKNNSIINSQSIKNITSNNRSVLQSNQNTESPEKSCINFNTINDSILNNKENNNTNSKLNTSDLFLPYLQNCNLNVIKYSDNNKEKLNINERCNNILINKTTN